MPEDESEEGCVGEQQQHGERGGGGGGGAAAAAAGGGGGGVQLPLLSNTEVKMLQQQLQQQLQQLFLNPSADAKAAANRWLVQFQRSLEAWQVARYILEEHVLVGLQQQQQQQQVGEKQQHFQQQHQQQQQEQEQLQQQQVHQQQGSVGQMLDDQLLLLAAQTLAWKVIHQPEHLSLQEKKQLAIFLLHLSGGLQQQQQQLGSQLLGPLLSRLAQCIAHCVVHCAEVTWCDAVADIVAFACSSIAAAAATYAATRPAEPIGSAIATATAEAAAEAAATRSSHSSLFSPSPPLLSLSGSTSSPPAPSISVMAAIYKTTSISLSPSPPAASFSFSSSPSSSVSRISIAIAAASSFFTLPCCLALWSLAAIPDALKSLDAPTRGGGCRRTTETPQALCCERQTKAVLDLAADILLARAAIGDAGATATAAVAAAVGDPAGAAQRRSGSAASGGGGGGGEEAITAAQTKGAAPSREGRLASFPSVAAASDGLRRRDSSLSSPSSSSSSSFRPHSASSEAIAAAAAAAAAATYEEQQQDIYQRTRQRWCVEEGVLPLLINWMGFWEQQPYLQHELLCESLAAIIHPLAAEPALTDCLVAAMPRLSTYMQLWGFTVATVPPPPPLSGRNGSTVAVVDGSGRTHNVHSSSTAAGSSWGPAGGARGGGGADSSSGRGGGGGTYNTNNNNNNSEIAQQQLLLAWADPGIPTTGGGEGLLCDSILQQFVRFSAGLAVKERTQEMLLLKYKQGMLLLQQHKLQQHQQHQQQQQQQEIQQKQRLEMQQMQQQHPMQEQQQLQQHQQFQAQIQQQQQAILTEERRQLSLLQQQLNDSAELALLLRWGSVLQTFIEGFPAALLEAPSVAARLAAAIAPLPSTGGEGEGGGGGGHAVVCGELLLQLWRQHPQTWICASNVWGVVKELRRDQLLPSQILQLLLQRLAPTCIKCLLQHCRRDSPWWRFGGRSTCAGRRSKTKRRMDGLEKEGGKKEAEGRGGAGGGGGGGEEEEEEKDEEEEEDEEANEEEWNGFVESAGDTACDLFFLYGACGRDESRAFLESLGESMQIALQQGDAAGAEVLLLLTDAVVEGLNCIPLPLAPLFLCLPALPRTSAPCAAALAKLLKKAAIHFTEEDPEYDGLLTTAPHALETATPCGAAMLKKLWFVALQTLLQLLPLHPRLGADSILQLTTWGGHHLSAASAPSSGNAAAAAVGGGGVAAFGGSPARGASEAGGVLPSSSCTSRVSASDVSAHLRGIAAETGCVAGNRESSGSLATTTAGEGGSEALEQLEMFCSFVEETGPRYAVQVDATLHAAAVKLILALPRKDIPILFNRSMRGTRQLLQRCLVLFKEEKSSPHLLSSTSSSFLGGGVQQNFPASENIAAVSLTPAATANERRRYVSRILQRLESCCSALSGGKVCVSRSSAAGTTMIHAQQPQAGSGGVGGAGGGGGTTVVEEEEEEGEEAAAALQYFLSEDNLWMALLQVMRTTLLKTAATAFPTNAVTKQRVHFGLLIDLKSRETLQHPQDSSAVLMVLTIRCLRLLLRGLGTEASIVPSLWSAAAELVSELVSSALLLVDTAATEAASTAAPAPSASTTARRIHSSSLGAQAALQACGVVLLGDLLRISSASTLGGRSTPRQATLLQAAKAWAAQGLEQITLLYIRLGMLLNGRQNYYDIFSPYFDFLLAYAAAAAPSTTNDTYNSSGRSTSLNGVTGCYNTVQTRRPLPISHLNNNHNNNNFVGQINRYDGEILNSSTGNNVGNNNTNNNNHNNGRLILQQDDLFAQPGFEATLRVAVDTLRHQDADIARQCIVYCHACASTPCGAPSLVDHIIEGYLPQIVVAILNNLHCWGLENLSVLWKAFALWSDKYHTVFLRTVSEWLANTSVPSFSSSSSSFTVLGDIGSGSASSRCSGGGAVVSTAYEKGDAASQPERLNAPQAAMWRGIQSRRSLAVGGDYSRGIGREGEEEKDGPERLLRGMDAAQKEVVICSFRNFRGARMRQLLQDLCLIASGAMLPSDALIAYEYALQAEQKTMAKDKKEPTGGAAAEMVD